MIILQLPPVFQLQDLSETVPMPWEEELFIQFEEVFILARAPIVEYVAEREQVRTINRRDRCTSVQIEIYALTALC